MTSRAAAVKQIVDNITLKDLQRQFHQPITMAAKHFGICVSILKRVCRRHGIPKWPQRTLRSLQRQIEILQNNIPTVDDPAHREQLVKELKERKLRMTELYGTDSFNATTPTLRLPSPPVPTLSPIATKCTIVNLEKLQCDVQAVPQMRGKLAFGSLPARLPPLRVVLARHQCKVAL